MAKAPSRFIHPSPRRLVAEGHKRAKAPPSRNLRIVALLLSAHVVKYAR